MELRERSGRAYVGTRGLGVLARLAAVVAVAAAVLGPAYAVNGATRAGAEVAVLPDPAPYQDLVVLPPQESPGDLVVVPGGWPDGVQLVVRDGRLELTAWDSTVAEQLLARGDVALLGLVVGGCALLLLPLLRAVAQGEPFRRGGALRLALAAVLVTVHGVVAPLLPAAATTLVVERVGLDAEGQVAASATFPLAPFLLAVGLLVLAEAFRRGEQIAHDVEGLV